MFSPKRDETRPGYEMRKEHIAIGVMILLCLPILAIYVTFFAQAFVADGKLSLSNFRFLYTTIVMGQYTVPTMGPAFRNTVVFTLCVTACEVVISLMAGYALSRMRFTGRNFLQKLLLILRLFPGVLLLISILYVLMYTKLLNTLLGVVLFAIALRLPGSTFIIRNFFNDIPKDIENSALVDGCNRLTAFFQVIIHMVKPGIASISMFAFMSAWSNYLLFNTLILTGKVPIMATYLRSLSMNDQMIADYGVFSAMALVYMLPVFVFFIISQKSLMIRIENLRKEYDAKTVALDGIDLVFEDSTFVALLGPSGCGKTTTLNCIAGLLEPTSGKIFFGDKDVTQLQPKDRNIGMVFQSYALYPHLKVIDNIAFPLKQKGMKKAERYEKVRKIAKMLQIEYLLERKPTQLSGGQQQRVSMARALVKEPDVLLLDEPMSNLDARLKIEIRIQQYDTPEHLYHYPANLFVAKFMGNPPMNFIDAALSADGTRVEGAGFSLPLEQHMAQGGKKFAGHAVKVGVRSHLMAVHTEKVPQAMEMRLQIAENLGKEILISGMVGDSFVRVTVPENHDTFEQYKAISRSEKPLVYLTMTGVYNIFDTESGVNIALEK